MESTSSGYLKESIGIPEGTSSGYLKESIGIPESTSSGYLKESIGIPEGISSCQICRCDCKTYRPPQETRFQETRFSLRVYETFLREGRCKTCFHLPREHGTSCK